MPNASVSAAGEAVPAMILDFNIHNLDQAAALTAMIDRLLAAVEYLLGELDAVDGDPDLEPYLAGWRFGPADDLEDDGEEYEAGGDDEPALGWTLGGNQSGRKWWGNAPAIGTLAYAVEDGEHEHDGREEDDAGEDGGDREPSLGAPEVYLGTRMVDGDAIWPKQTRVRDGGMDQGRWGRASLDDREDEHDGREGPDNTDDVVFP